MSVKFYFASRDNTGVSEYIFDGVDSFEELPNLIRIVDNGWTIFDKKYVHKTKDAAVREFIDRLSGVIIESRDAIQRVLSE